MNHNNKKKKIFIALIFMTISILQLFTEILKFKENEVTRKASKEEIERSKLNLEAELLHDFLSCKFEPRVCEKLYPSAFESIKKTKVETEEE